MLPVQCKMARVAIGIGVRDLADMAKVSPDTVARLERGDALKERTVDAIRHALESRGIEFIAENGGGAGVRLRGASPEHVRDAAQVRWKATAAEVRQRYAAVAYIRIALSQPMAYN